MDRKETIDTILEMKKQTAEVTRKIKKKNTTPQEFPVPTRKLICGLSDASLAAILEFSKEDLESAHKRLKYHKQKRKRK